MPRTRKNERIRTLEQQLNRNGFEVMSRGLPTMLALKRGVNGQPDEARWIYMRRKYRKKRGLMAGLTKNQQKVLKILEAPGQVVKISVL